ncbi:kinetochore protein Spc24 [Aix galericulata]|nr:kinetochore protein Spc24 [Aix galericulata]
MLSERLQELEEVSKELLKVLLEDWAGARLRRSLDKRRRAEDKLLATQAAAAQMGTELAAAEEAVARSLLERQQELQRGRRRLRELEEEELEELRGQSRRLEEGGEQEAEAVPSAAYVTQLYYKISRIDWDYEAEPAQIKGIHYGPDIAQPIDIDGRQHSRCFVSDYLWSLVPTAW